MPDIISVISRRSRLIFLLTLLATVVALMATLLSPKLYLSTATALPANSVLSDKARIFNTNIEGLYPSLGSPDELDRIEGTTKLDTLFIAMANDFQLAIHYGINDDDAAYKAALHLKKNSSISRSAYGELKIKIWDRDKIMAAQLANSFLQKLNDFHQHIQNANTAMLLKLIKAEVAAKEKKIDSIEKNVISDRLSNSVYNSDTTPNKSHVLSKDARIKSIIHHQFKTEKVDALISEIKVCQNLISQYELSLKTTPNVLVVVESARPALNWDKPNLVRNLVFSFFASLLFSFLLAVFIDSRKEVA